jgi:hypothetical protein
MNEVVNLSLWGNYTIPKDNPNADDSNLRPEIWALGLENPWRCSFDSARPFHLYCADDVQVSFECYNHLRNEFLPSLSSVFCIKNGA